MPSPRSIPPAIAIALTLLSACPTLAPAVEVLVATGASIPSGRDRGARSAHLISVRELFAREPGAAALGAELGGSPAVLVDRTSGALVRAALFVRAPQRVQIGAGALAQRLSAAAVGANLRAGFEWSGALQVPLGPGAGLDLGARYAWFPPSRTAAPAPDRFADRFWTLTAGVAFTL